jgi:hypothetical protein
VFASIFLDFSLPNATTWFYFSFLLAVAIFFRFDRFLSLRNLDLIGLYLMIPGLLLIQEAHAIQALIPAGYRNAPLSPVMDEGVGLTPEQVGFLRHSRSLLAAGYIWLVIGTAFAFLRCVFDLGLEKRPTLAPNVNLPGMA